MKEKEIKINKEEKNKSKKNKKENKLISAITKFNILAIVCIIIISIAVTPKTLQNDTYYTIKVGEAITTYGIDMQEHFSWHEGLTYTYPHWLYDLATYNIYTHFGFDGIYAATMILSCILGISLYMTNSKLSKNNLVSFILTILEMILLTPYIAARAQLVSFILFVLTNYFIERFIETRKIKYAVGLLIIPVIIANVHAAVFPFYFVFFIPAIVEYILASLRDSCIMEKVIVKYSKKSVTKFEKNKQKFLAKGKTQEDYDKKIIELNKKVEVANEKLVKTEEKNKEAEENPYKFKHKKNDNVKWLFLIILITAFAGLLTPIGDTPYTYLYKTFEGNTTEYISEHLPMTLAQSPEALALIGIILGILLLSDTKINLRDGFMIAGMCILMLFTRRQFSMFTIVAIIVIAKMLNDLINKYDKDCSNNIMDIINTISGKVLVISLVMMLALLIYKQKKDAKYIDDATYPVEAADYIKENLIGLDNFKLYNEYDYGSYLLFRDIPVFIDSRADVYDPKFNGLSQDIFTDDMNINGITVYYEKKFSEYGITHVMAYRNSKLVMLLMRDKNYKLVYYDEHFAIYERLNANDNNKENEDKNKDNIAEEKNNNDAEDNNNVSDLKE